MPTCTFCSKSVNLGRGMRIFRRDGSSSFYCSHKCEVNAAMGRKPASLKWAGGKVGKVKAKAKAKEKS